MNRLTAAVTVGCMSLVTALSLPTAAQTGSDEIQVLTVEQADNGDVEIQIAIPASIGEIAPVRENFGLLVDGDVTNFSVDPVLGAVDVVVIIDTSGSMQGAAIAAAKSAAVTFIQELDPAARVAVIGFGPVAEVVSPLGTDRTASVVAVETLAARGETALWDSLILAASLLQEADAAAPYVIVLSDGDDTIRPDAQDEAEAALRSAGSGLYAVAIESPDSNKANLEAAVNEVGGQYLATSDLTSLGLLYQDIAERLRSRYTLRFSRATNFETTAVISVAADGSIATARTEIGSGERLDAGSIDKPAPVLNIESLPQLSTVTRPEGGLFASSAMLGLGALAVFGSILLIGFQLAIPGTNVRLSAAGARTGDAVADGTSKVTAAANRIVAVRDSGGELDAALDAAGLNLRPGEFVLIGFTAMVIAGIVGSILGGAVLAVTFLLLAALASYLVVAIRTSRRRAAFADQLTDTLGIMTGSLRSGRGLPQAIELVSTEAASPTKEQFRRIVFETRVGRDLTESITSVAGRMRNTDLEWVARAVDINRELGGDLTEVLDNVADTIRDRRRIARQVKALSAEGKASGWVLLSLPIVMFLFLAVRSPDQVALLTDTSPGRVMLVIGITGMVVGYLWIRKLVDVKY